MTHHNPNQPPEYGPHVPYSHFAQPAPQPPKKKRKWPWIVGGVAAVIVIAVAANPDSAKEGFEDGYNAGGDPTTAVDERPTPVDAPPAPAVPAQLPDNGTLRVGTDIQPGGYVVSLGDDAFMGDTGYWERLSCLTGDFSCIISNEIVQGPGYLTVLPTDVAVKVQNVRLVPEG